MKLSYLLIPALLATLSISACGKKEQQKQESEKVSVTLDWTPNTNHTGLYVAKELGYFTEVGLDVDILQPGQGVTDQIVAAGKSQFGVSYQENVIRARSESIPLVSIAAIIQHNTSGFASLKTAGIKAPKDFEGKRYGSWDSPSEQAILKNIMTKNKADFSAVKIVSGVYDFFSTIGKDADFEWIYYGWDGVEAKRRGIEIDYIALKDLNPVFDYYTPVIITNEKLLSENPELAKKFLTAVSRGYEYCIANPQKAADILMKHVPELNAEQVKLSMEYLAKEYQSDATKWGSQKPEVWQRFIDWMYVERLIPISVETAKAYSNDYLP
ncbi:MAG: ABC transporter substrate-binding protein [Candidatus Cloacimonetes bacterium HGW-Cloacimonetes-3]|jgi:ABC-type nitrate/sulfonate/bicarbonate transport system substrate-binding protein|nr:MAG: ABC transporter substrate-binding protein [Candidatus Cloacimonetes bacterium HGW-Cloacimonetes-3]